MEDGVPEAISGGDRPCRKLREQHRGEDKAVPVYLLGYPAKIQ